MDQLYNLYDAVSPGGYIIIDDYTYVQAREGQPMAVRTAGSTGGLACTDPQPPMQRADPPALLQCGLHAIACASRPPARERERAPPPPLPPPQDS